MQVARHEHTGLNDSTQVHHKDSTNIVGFIQRLFQEHEEETRLEKEQRREEEDICRKERERKRIGSLKIG